MEKKKILAFISNEGQYGKFREMYPGRTDIFIVTDNESFTGCLDAKGEGYLLLDEIFLRDKWDEISEWSSDKSLNWVRISGEARNIFGGFAMNEAFYVYFTCYLMGFLRSYLYIRYFLERYCPEEVIFFDFENCMVFPEFDGNYFINRLLGDDPWGGLKRTPIVMDAGENRLGAPARPIKEVIRDVVQKVYSRSVRPGDKKGVYLFSGSLRLLSPIIKAMAGKGHRVVFYDIAFQFEQHRFCRKEGIEYLLPGMFRGTRSPGQVLDAAAGFKTMLEIWEKNRWFTYEGIDLSGRVSAFVRGSSGDYLRDLSSSAGIYEEIIEKYGVRALIIDEDWTARKGGMAAFVRSRGIKAFCVSHGYGAQRFTVAPDKRGFALSETFVQSEFEKDLYIRRGWDERHVHVTGIPKNDTLAGLRKLREGMSKNGRMRILFCGNVLQEYDTVKSAYIGVNQFERGRYMRDCFLRFARVIEGLDVEVIVRPHPPIDEHDPARWEKIVNSCPLRDRMRIRGIGYEFFDLLADSDIMVVGHWSTAISEALAAGVPVIVDNCLGFPEGYAFPSKGICLMAGDEERLKSYIAGFADKHAKGVPYGTLPLDDPVMVYCLGSNDGDNTRRVVEKIMEISGGSSEDNVQMEK